MGFSDTLQTNRDATAKQVDRLAELKIGLPRPVTQSDLTDEYASRLLVMFDADMFHGQRKCRHCYRNLLVVSPWHQEASQFWGKELADNGVVCVGCLRKGKTTTQRQRQRLAGPVGSEPTVSLPLPSKPKPDPVEQFNPPDFNPPDFRPPDPTQPIGYYPRYNRPEPETLTWIWYLAKRYEGCWDVSDICDLILGETILLRQQNRKLRIRCSDLDHLPQPGEDLKRYEAAHNRINLERLIQHGLDILCSTGEILYSNGILKANAPAQLPPSQPADSKPTPFETNPELRQLHRLAIQRALSELPPYARTQQAVKIKAHHWIDQVGRIWDAGCFDLAWAEFANHKIAS